jgi:hypothetical protein
MSKILKHEFYEFYKTHGENISIASHQTLMINDGCKFCGLIIDTSHFEQPGHYKLTIRQNKINETYPCITEEEYIIKKLLE